MSGGTPVAGGLMRQRHSQGYASSGDDLEDDACSRHAATFFAPAQKQRTWVEDQKRPQGELEFEQMDTMDDVALQLQRKLIDYTNSLFHECLLFVRLEADRDASLQGYINNQFSQLQQLQEESKPNFVARLCPFSSRILSCYSMNKVL